MLFASILDRLVVLESEDECRARPHPSLDDSARLAFIVNSLFFEHLIEADDRFLQRLSMELVDILVGLRADESRFVEKNFVGILDSAQDMFSKIFSNTLVCLLPHYFLRWQFESLIRDATFKLT